jgi:translation initiation factor 2B subunit (eIF-2B alpha/beta/delta family)
MKFREMLKEDSSINEATKTKNLESAKKFEVECQKVSDEIAKVNKKLVGLVKTAKKIGLDASSRDSEAKADKLFDNARYALDEADEAIERLAMDAIFYHEGDDVSEGSEKN